MPRRRCKIKSIDEIKSLDSSSVPRLCSSSVPEQQEEALREAGCSQRPTVQATLRVIRHLRTCPL